MTDTPKALKLFSPTRIAITIIIGLSVATYLVAKDFKIEYFQSIEWTWQSTFWILIALLMIVLRDFSYMIRIRILTDNQISWRNSFDTIMLWEFASAVTPSTVGGSGVAIYLVNKEGISLGRSTAVVLSSALLDELFYIIMVPLVLLFVGVSDLFPVQMETELFGFVLGTKGIFVAGYCLILVLTISISYAIFFRPRGFKWILLKIFKLSFLKKWRNKAANTGDEMIVTSKEFRNKPFSFWLKAFFATLGAWTGRFWVVNFLILAFISVDQHLLIYARQLVMWLILLMSPTPGGTGVAEFAFEGFLTDFIPIGLAGTLALLWRVLSYWPYIFIGVIVLPKWLKRTHSTESK